MTHLLSALVLAVVLCSGYAHAQQNNSTSENSQTANAALREKAFNLLESVAGQVDTLQSAENRARLGSNLIDSLWKHDEKRARSLLTLVEQDIKTGLENRDTSDRRDVHTLMVFLKLRADTVERVAKHDPELALAFLKATKLSSDKPLPYGMVESDHGFELRLAKQVAANNPDVAIKLARQSLARGFSHDLLALLRQLSRKHKEPSQILYKEVVKKLSEADFANDWGVRYFAQSLAQSFRPPAADESTFHDLVGLFVTSALANGCGDKMSDDDDRAGYCRWIASTLPQMEKIDPRAARLKQWVFERDEHGQVSPAYMELNDLIEQGTVDEILALASKYPEIKPDIYWRATLKARAAGDFEQARKLASSYTADPERRRLMLAQLDLDQSRASVSDEKLVELQNRLNTIRQTQDRVWFLLSHASQFGERDRNAALKLLKQASEMVYTMKPGKDQTEAQVGLAMIYCLEKDERGFAIMESLVPKLNELVDMAAKLDGYDTNYLRDGEWNMSANGSVGGILTRLAQNAAYFAWCDFDRAVSLAAQFDRAEIRLMAQLKLAQSILAGPPKRIQTEAYY